MAARHAWALRALTARCSFTIVNDAFSAFTNDRRSPAAVRRTSQSVMIGRLWACGSLECVLILREDITKRFSVVEYIS